MALDYEKTRAAFQEELEKLALLRAQIAEKLEWIDKRIEAVSSASDAFERAFSVATSPAPRPPVLTPLPAKEVGITEARPEFEITANVREILQEGKGLSAPAIRDALISKGWDIEAKRYKNPLAVVHQVLNRLIKNGDVEVERSHWNGKVFYDRRMAAEREAERERQLAEGRAWAEKTALARAEVRTTLLDQCRSILRSYPKGISSKRIYRELRKTGIDLSCYNRPTSGIATALAAAPDVKSFRVDSDGVIRTHWRLIENEMKGE
jgi:hypothetical protein